MHELLKSVQSIPGVTGTALFNANGTCLVNKLPATYQPKVVREMITELTSMFQVLTCVDGYNSEQIVISLDDGMFAFRVLEGMSLTVFGNHAVNTAKLNVGCAVLARKLRQLRPYPADSGKNRSIEKIPALSKRDILNKIEANKRDVTNGEPENPSDKKRAASDPQLPTTAISATDSINAKQKIEHVLLKRLTKRFTHYVGPMAKVIVTKRCAKMGVSSQLLSIGQIEQLMVELSIKIANERQRARFMRDVYDLVATAHKLARPTWIDESMSKASLSNLSLSKPS